MIKTATPNKRVHWASNINHKAQHTDKQKPRLIRQGDSRKNNMIKLRWHHRLIATIRSWADSVRHMFKRIWQAGRSLLRSMLTKSKTMLSQLLENIGLLSRQKALLTSTKPIKTYPKPCIKPFNPSKDSEKQTTSTKGAQKQAKRVHWPEGIPSPTKKPKGYRIPRRS